jgi:hypothetical protein
MRVAKIRHPQPCSRSKIPPRNGGDELAIVPDLENRHTVGDGVRDGVEGGGSMYYRWGVILVDFGLFWWEAEK